MEKEKTGVSLFYLEAGVDEGDIIAQKAFSIKKNDTILDLLNKTKKASIKIIKEQVPKIIDGVAKREAQNHNEATYFPSRSPKDGEIDFSWDADKISRFIRAQTHPYPGAFFCVEGKKVIIWSATIQDLKSNI